MNRIAVAQELLKIAKELAAMEFPSQDALDKYLKDHPDADRSMHTVKETKKEEKAPEKKEAPLKKHTKAKVNTKTLAKVKNVMEANKLTDDSDEMKEMAGFKKTLGQRVPEKDVGKYYARNATKLKKDFLANMDPLNYKDAEAFAMAKKRLQEMPVNDFAKVLAAVNDEEEV